MIAERSRKGVGGRPRSDGRRNLEPLTPEQAMLASDPILIESAKFKANRCVKRYPTADYESILSDLHLAILQAARTFDPSRGVSFRTHADRRMVGAVSDYLRDIKRVGFAGGYADARRDEFAVCVISLFAPVGLGYRGPLSTLDMVAAPSSSMVEMLDYDLIESVLAALTDRERSIIDMYVFGGYTMKEIGRTHGLSESRVSQVYGELTERLRRTIRRRLDATA